ncbi:conserved exported hypothetical protein [Cupriavidus necator]|uniref:Uncharacterized protein n=1 Tax=Cupriavidus necator TaxID=106590 RepID=A0A1K0JNM1_CUPNE|nr:conserved exported hypothetical protein [Cupriavidus necator]
MQLLRVVILIAATVALVCVVLLGLRASEGLFVKPIEVSEEIKIAPKSFKTGKIAEAPKTAESKAQTDEVKKLAQALGNVLSKHFSRLVKPAGSLNAAAIEEIVGSYVNDKDFGPIFVEGLTKYLDESLGLDESAAGTKSPDSFFGDVDKIFKHYETQYKAERSRIESEKRAAVADAEAKKLDAIQALYWSASCFAGFGMLVLLIVLIRVERSIHRLAASNTMAP